MKSILLCISATAILLSISSCRDLEDLNDDGSGDMDSASEGDADADSDADGDSDSGTEEVNHPPVHLYGVDILVVVDNSSSMRAEQQILSNALFSLIAALPDPAVGADIHIAFTTSDMGLSWGGNAFDPDNDGWPGGSAPEGCENLRGDEGRFITAYTTPTVQIGNEERSCPQLPDSMEQPFFSSSTISWQETDLALAAACTANVGIDGCGFEQQLTAATAALQGDGIDSGFMRADAMLLVLLVSDEEDCSMEDGPGLFAADEVQDQYKRNIACGRNQEFLYSTAEIKEMIINAKAAVSGVSRAVQSVMFAAIVGVPNQGDAGAACQGSGAEITGCLDVALEEGTMGDPGIIERMPPNTTAGPTAYYFEYACERFDADDTPVTQAYPGTRFVQLAREFGHLGYVYSICNADWAPAMNDIARIITDNLSTDSGEPFDTDSDTEPGSYCDGANLDCYTECWGCTLGDPSLCGVAYTDCQENSNCAAYEECLFDNCYLQSLLDDELRSCIATCQNSATADGIALFTAYYECIYCDACPLSCGPLEKPFPIECTDSGAVDSDSSSQQ